jgi:hypothetical protein
MRVCYRSAPIFVIIGTFWVFYMYGGWILFSENDTEAGYYFDDLISSWLNIFVLFTLSNYPYI